MPRRTLFLTQDYPYHVVSRSNNKERFYLPIGSCWKVFADSLSQITVKHQVQIFAFVLMTNHFHLILNTPRGNLGDVMRDFLTTVSKSIQFTTDRINHVFGARYKWSVLDSAYSVAYVTKYVLRNPVRAGIAARVEHYPYSSLFFPGLAPQLPLVCGINDIWDFVPRSRPDLLAWLNQPTPTELEHQITLGLRKVRFKFSTDNNNQRSLRELRNWYCVPPHLPKDDRYLSLMKVD